MHGWWEYPSNVLERKEVLLTAVVLVVRHKSLSFFSLEKKKQWKKQTNKTQRGQLNEWKLHSLACSQSKRSILRTSFSQQFPIHVLSFPRELTVIPELQDSIMCHVLHAFVREKQEDWGSQSYYKEYFVGQIELFIFSSDWHSSICADKR